MQSQALRAAATVLVAAGCAAYEEKPLDAAAELAALRARAVPAAIVERAVPRWEEPATVAFNPTDGLDEAELVSLALTQNPQLAARRLALGEAQAQLIIAGVWPNPELQAGYRPGLSAPGYSVDADFLFDLLRPWERAARKKAAAAVIDETSAGVASAEWDLAARVRSQHVEVLFAESSLAVLEEEAELRRRVLDLVRRGKEIGERSALEVSAAELELADAEREVRRTRGQVEAARFELGRLVGTAPGAPLELSASGKPLAVALYGDIADAEIERRLLQGRFELRAKEAAYQRAEAELRLAVYRQYPRFKVGPSFGHEPEGDDYLGVGASLELPLFDRNQGQIAEKLGQRDRLRAEYAALLHELSTDASSARARLRRAKAEVEAQEKGVLPVLERSRELFEGAFRARDIDFLDWLAAQGRALRARSEYLRALADYRRALIELETALGSRLKAPAEARGEGA
jgi:outer membrane protein TolC